MNRTVRKASLIAAAVAAVSLSGCAYSSYDTAYGYGYGYGSAYYPAYYDGYYGPYYDGYWGPGGFYFFDVNVNRFVLDDGRHFRREAAPGFRQIPRTSVARAMRPIPQRRDLRETPRRERRG